MSDRLEHWVFKSMLGLSLLLAVVFVTLWTLNLELWSLDAGPRLETGYGSWLAPLILTLDGIAFAVVGWLVASRRPDNAVGRVCMGIGLAIVISTSTIEYGAYSILTAPGSLQGGEVAVWLGNWSWVVYVGLIVTVLVLVFPDGELRTWGDRVVMVLSVTGMSATIVYFALAPGPLTSLPWAINPFGLTGQEWLEWFSLGFVLLVATMLAAAWSMRQKYRYSTGVARAQIRWFTAAAVLVATSYVGHFVFSLVSGSLDGRVAPAQRMFQDLTIATFGVLGVSIGVAVHRYRLYDIDRIISRTVSYALVVALLGLVVFGLVTAMAIFLPSDDPLVVAVVTLMVYALFNPLRRRVQRLVDRRFNRSGYDAERVIDQFTGSLRDRVDADEVVEGWLGVVDSTMQPTFVGVWVRE